MKKMKYIFFITIKDYKMSHQEEVHQYNKNKNLEIFEYQKIFIFLFFYDHKTHHLLEEGIYVMKKNKLKFFSKFNDISSVCSVVYQIKSSINNFIFNYNRSFDDQKKLTITDNEQKKKIILKCSHVSDEVIINNLINNIEKIIFKNNIYNTPSIYNYGTKHIVLYYNPSLFTRDNICIKIYENDIKIADEFFQNNYSNCVWINVNDKELIINKYRTDNLSFGKEIFKKININDVNAKNIKDEIEMCVLDNIKESKKISEWINFYQIKNFLSFGEYDLKFE